MNLCIHSKNSFLGGLLNETIFSKGSKPNQLVVAFHGTGGNEYQLLTTIATLLSRSECSKLLRDRRCRRTATLFAPLVNGALPRANFDERVTAFLEEVWQPQKLYDEVIL